MFFNSHVLSKKARKGSVHCLGQIRYCSLKMGKSVLLHSPLAFNFLSKTVFFKQETSCTVEREWEPTAGKELVRDHFVKENSVSR